VLLAALFCLAAQTTAPADVWTWRVGAVPTLTYNTDEAFGTGGVASLFVDDGHSKPYRHSLTLNAFISTKGVQSHALTWDGLRPFNLDGRMHVRLGYLSTVSQNYCGTGNSVTCDDSSARRAAEAAGMSNDDVDAAARHFTQMRFRRPFLSTFARGWIVNRSDDNPWRVELFGGVRASLLLPGDWTTPTPYPGSLYATEFPAGERGLSVAPFIGAIADSRDDEIFPQRGIYGEVSVRTAQPLWRSTWAYTGGTAIIAGFWDVMPSAWRGGPQRAVLASRAIADILVGDPSTEELARIGGTNDVIAFGGGAIGRGIREHRYLGKVKLMAQTELRLQLVTVHPFGEEFDLGTAFFTDLGMIGYDVHEWRGHPTKILPTVGVSWRILWNKTFAFRWDLATSPAEENPIGFYIIVGQVF
jgi:Omp85 superfamily domain